ncbi:hypothetical protein ACFSRY_02970 [Pontibacter locisalis]|uniref:DUF5602 domain-containing protein n=1 Tax=Pontibacter locisalis TaxID=1719035 RepID=A0ABW5IHE0_9BACT
MKHSYKTRLALCLLIIITGVFTGCDKQEDIVPDQLKALSVGEAKARKTTIYYGPATPVGKGTARTWVETNEKGEPLAVGVNLSDKAAATLPHEVTVYMLQMPKNIKSVLYNFVMLDWNPAGHAPDHFYASPHFDFHFYMAEEGDVLNIPSGLHAHTPEFEANYVPADHVTGAGLANMGEAIPAMGVHWIDALSPELHGKAFTKTFIYGSYNNKVTFHEPMITLAYLQELILNEPVVTPVPQPKHVQMSGYHPQTYTIEHDGKQSAYKVSLSDLVYRKAQ